jgi:hypothetical protein
MGTGRSGGSGVGRGGAVAASGVDGCNRLGTAGNDRNVGRHSRLGARGTRGVGRDDRLGDGAGAVRNGQGGRLGNRDGAAGVDRDGGWALSSCISERCTGTGMGSIYRADSGVVLDPSGRVDRGSGGGNGGVVGNSRSAGRGHKGKDGSERLHLDGGGICWYYV